MKRRIAHFLFGSSLRNLLHARRIYGPISFRYMPRYTLICLGSLLLSFWSIFETITARKRIQRTLVEKHPVFIIGHWRSGTTHLHNILSHDPQFGYLTVLQAIFPYYFLGNPWLLRFITRRFLPKERLVDSVRQTVNSPMEEGLAMANMTPYSNYHSFYFPKSQRLIFKNGVELEGDRGKAKRDWKRQYLYLVKKLTLFSGGKQLILKDPAHTARISILLELFPDAKFIHIHRDPFKVIPSTKRLYSRAIEELSFQDVNVETLSKPVVSQYRALMEHYFDNCPHIPSGNLVEVAFDELDSEPLKCLKRIYRELGLRGWNRAEGSFKDYLSSVADYRPTRHACTVAECKEIREYCSETLSRWGYNDNPHESLDEKTLASVRKVEQISAAS